MIKFKQKNYTIEEGHYTGPKDLEKIPSSLEVIGKSTIGGSAAGGIIGGVLKTAGVDEASITGGISTGGKAGFVKFYNTIWRFLRWQSQFINVCC